MILNTTKSLLVCALLAFLLLLPCASSAQEFVQSTDVPFFDVRAGASAFADVDNDGDNDILLVGNRAQTSLPQNQNFVAVLYENDGQGNFSEVSGTPFIGLQEASIAFADVDGDDDQDVMISGIDYSFAPYTLLYINDGSGNFSELFPSPFVDTYSGDIEFADVDGDGDLDVFVAGSTVAFEAISTSKLYINGGAGDFVEQANTPFAHTQESSIGISDIDMDGDLDMLTLGTSEVPGPITEAYLNDGAGNFTVATGYDFEQLSSGDIEFADIDNDGDEDLLITGTTDGGLTPYTILYANDGSGNFTEIENSILLDLKFGDSIFSDFNNDGFPDLLMTGKSSNDPDIFSSQDKEAILYMNDGNGVFIEVENSAFLPLDLSHVAVGDVNGDDLIDVFVNGTLDRGVTHSSELFINSTVLSTMEIVREELFDLYPNPVSGGDIRVRFENVERSNRQVSVMDMLGKRIALQTSVIGSGELTVDVSPLQSGTYLLVVDSDLKRTTRKFSVVK